jgi:hypothetical protein
MEVEALRLRERHDSSGPSVDVTLFLGQPTSKEAHSVPGVPRTYPEDFIERFGMSPVVARAAWEAGTWGTERLPHAFKIANIPEEQLPFRGSGVPLTFESPEVRMGAFLLTALIYGVRDIGMSTGVTEYFEREYDRLAFVPLLQIVRDPNVALSVRKAVLAGLQNCPYEAVFWDLLTGEAHDDRLGGLVVVMSENILRNILRQSVDISIEGAIRSVMDFDLLHGRKEFLQRCLKVGSDRIVMLAKNALAALKQASDGVVVVGIPLEPYLLLSMPDVDLLKSVAIYVRPLFSAGIAAQENELKALENETGAANSLVYVPVTHGDTPIEVSHAMRADIREHVTAVNAWKEAQHRGEKAGENAALFMAHLKSGDASRFHMESILLEMNTPSSLKLTRLGVLTEADSAAVDFMFHTGFRYGLKRAIAKLDLGSAAIRRGFVILSSGDQRSWQRLDNNVRPLEMSSPRMRVLTISAALAASEELSIDELVRLELTDLRPERERIVLASNGLDETQRKNIETILTINGVSPEHIFWVDGVLIDGAGGAVLDQRWLEQQRVVQNLQQAGIVDSVVIGPPLLEIIPGEHLHSAITRIARLMGVISIVHISADEDKKIRNRLKVLMQT